MVLLANPRVLEENLPSDQQQNCKVLHMHILEHNKHNIKIESVDRLRIGRTNITKDSNLIMLKSIQFLNGSKQIRILFNTIILGAKCLSSVIKE